MSTRKRKARIVTRDIIIILALFLWFALTASAGWFGTAYITEQLAPRVYPDARHAETRSH